MAEPVKPLAEFEQARKQLGQRFKAAGQQQSEALKRRFAAQGGLSSGAFIKESGKQATNLAQVQEEAQSGIQAQETAERRRLGELQAQRDFTSGEAVKQRDFASEQAGIQRTFQTTEREGQNVFQKQLFDADQGFKKELFEFDKSFKGQQLDLQNRQFSAERVDEQINGALALIQSEVFDKDEFSAALESIRSMFGGGEFTGRNDLNFAGHTLPSGDRLSGPSTVDSGDTNLSGGGGFGGYL